MIVPVEGPIGTHECDYSFLETRWYDDTGVLVTEERSANFFSTGKLGALKGGLANFKDLRPTISQAQVVEAASMEVEQNLACKRSPWWIPC